MVRSIPWRDVLSIHLTLGVPAPAPGRPADRTLCRGMDGDVWAAVRGFDELADDYDRTRPVCPPGLFDDLVAVTGLSPGDRVVEIGCGTGQATVPLAERGLSVTAVEVGSRLAAIARRRLVGFPEVEVVTGAFEDWKPDRPEFDAVAAFNSLHWVSPAARYARPARLLRPGGSLLVASCRWARPEDAERFWGDVQEDYRAVDYEGSPPPPPEAIETWHLPDEATAHFEEIAARRYPFQVVYSAGDYLAILATQSTTWLLGDERRAEFIRRVRARLQPWPHVTATFVAQLTIGVLRADRNEA